MKVRDSLIIEILSLLNEVISMKRIGLKQKERILLRLAEIVKFVE